MKHRIRGIFALVTLTGTVATCPAEEEFIFPVGLWVTDMPGYDEYMTPSKLVDLRSKGIEMLEMNGDVTRLKKHLAMADSFWFKVYAVPSKFQAIAYYGHDDTAAVFPYFKNYNQIRYSSSTFNDTLDIKVS